MGINLGYLLANRPFGGCGFSRFLVFQPALSTLLCVCGCVCERGRVSFVGVPVRRTHLKTIILIGHVHGPHKFGSLRFVKYLLDRHSVLFTPASTYIISFSLRETG